MKQALLIIGLATGMALPTLAGETLRLKLEPERDYLLKGSPQEVVVKIDLSAAAGKTKARRTPLNLAVVLDRSGSMTGAKLEKARQAAMELVDRLAPGDTFSLIAYSTRAEVLIPAQEVRDKSDLKARISRITASGNTALYSGVKTGADEVIKHLSTKRINRIILLSDGLANAGPSSPRELRQLGRELAERGIAVTTVGVGDDYNEDLMAGLAEASDANYYYVKDVEKLPEIFAKELGDLLTVAARGVRIEIICPPGIKPIRLLGRPEMFHGQKAVVQLDYFTPGQDRYVFLHCRVERDEPELARVNVRYIDELNKGEERSVTEVARIRFTSDRELAGKSARSAVVAQKELLIAAVTKDEALACADAGRFDEAATRLANCATALDAQYANAPAPMQSQIRIEVENLRQRSNQLQQRQYDSGTRKLMQSESYNYRNAK